MPKKKDTQKEIEEFFKDDDEDIKEKEQITPKEEKQKEETKKEKIENVENIEDEKKEENIQKMLQTIKNNKKIPKDILKKIYSNIFENLTVSVIVMAYLFLIILGYFNIEKVIFEVDLKVFAGCLFFLTIILMEVAYRKKNKKIGIHSIECLVLSMLNLFFSYFYTVFFSKFALIVGVISISFGVYYIIKSIVIFFIMRNKFLNRMSDITEILSESYDKEDFKCQEV